MLDCQRALFDIPREVSYLSAASYSPLPKATQEAGHRGVRSKGQPWHLDGAYREAQFVRCRDAAARLIKADPADVALVASVAYGFATAAKLLEIPAGSRILVLEDDHASPVLEWHAGAQAGGYTVETVRAPSDGDWTAALLEAIDRTGAAPLALASISSVHWSDGCMIDLPAVAQALRRQGAAFAIDATHAVGVMDVDVGRLDPDFVMFPTYKWLLGPYGRAFLYVAKRRQNGVPLEQTTSGRRDVKSEDLVYFKNLEYVGDARRFDMGERDYFITMEMASVSMEYIAGLGQSAVEQRLRWATDRIADGISAKVDDAVVLEPRFRAPNILSVAIAPEKAKPLCVALAEENVFVSPRLGRVRIAPHVYNDEQDLDRCVEKFAACYAAI